MLKIEFQNPFRMFPQEPNQCYLHFSRKKVKGTNYELTTSGKHHGECKGYFIQRKKLR